MDSSSDAGATTALADLSLVEFCKKLAGPTPTPGGGSLAAAVTGLGAAAVSMAFRFPRGDQGVWMAGRVEELDFLRARALEQVDRDALAWAEVAGAEGLPVTGAPGEEVEREARVQQALRHALEVALETMEIAISALRLAAAGAADVRRSLQPDCLAGAQALWVGLEDAYLSVRANADELRDRDRAAERLRVADALRKEAAKLLVEVRGAAERARKMEA